MEKESYDLLQELSLLQVCILLYKRLCILKLRTS